MSAVRRGQDAAPTASRALVVGGGKGGTGKSLITVNLAAALSLDGQRVAVVDADLGLANLHLLLGIEPQPNLLQLIQPGRSSAEVRGSLFQTGPAAIRLLPGASGVERLAGLNRGELRRLVHRLESCLVECDWLLIDLSSGISPATRLFLRSAPEVLIVSNPEPSAMLDAYAVIKVLSESGHSGTIQVVMNRARDRTEAEACGRRLLATADRFLGRPLELVGCIPEDGAMRASVGRRRPLVLDDPGSPASAALREIARRLASRARGPECTTACLFSTAKALLAPRPRSTKSSCVL